MAYINCAKCPAQAFPTGESVCNGYLEEFQCVSKHKTYIDKEDVDVQVTCRDTERDEQSVSRCC